MRYNLAFLALILITLATPRPPVLAWHSPMSVAITWQSTGWHCLQRQHGTETTTLFCSNFGQGEHTVVWSWGPVEVLTRFVPGDTVRITDSLGAVVGESGPLEWPYQRWMPWAAKSP